MDAPVRTDAEPPPLYASVADPRPPARKTVFVKI